jgi:hypothetical protein
MKKTGTFIFLLGAGLFLRTFAQEDLSMPVPPPPAPLPAEQPAAAPAQSPAASGKASAPAAAVQGDQKLEVFSPEDDGTFTAGDPETKTPADASEPSTETAGKVAGATPESYGIQSGDTLWDICHKLLDNPWYWPKLWSLNQYITNPHQIYPGNQVVFFAGSETAPPKMDVVGPKADTVQVEEEPDAPPAQIVHKAPVESVVEPLVPPDGQIGRNLNIKLRPVLFISEKELKMAGRITHSGEPKMNLVFGDNVYLGFKEKRRVAVGDEYQVVEIVREVEDPDSNFGSLGYMVKRKAVVRVKCLYPKTVEALIVDQEDSVSRGEYVIPYESPIRTVTPSNQCEKNIKGKIAAGDHDQYLISNQDFVFLNRGRKDGLSNGQMLSVVRRGDGLDMQDDKGLPDVVFGRLLVVEANEHSATAYVTDLKDSLEVGDRVVCPAPTCLPDSKNQVSCR